MAGKSLDKTEDPSVVKLQNRMPFLVFAVAVVATMLYVYYLPDVAQRVSPQYYETMAQIVSVFFIAVPLTRSMLRIPTSQKRTRSLEFNFALLQAAFAELNCLWAIALGGTAFTFFGSAWGFAILMLLVVLITYNQFE